MLITSKEEKPITPKFCPFRKKTIFYQNDYTTHVEGEKVMVNLPRAEWMEEEFLPCIYEKCAVWNEKGQNCRNNRVANVKAIPAADVTSVHYGCWNADKEDVEWGNSLIRYRCSVCNERPHFDKEEYKFILSPYCPNCGAKMDGEP